MAPAVSGTKLHSLAATELRGWQAAGKLEEGIELSVEQSFKGGSIVNYGTKGSVRVDVAVRFNGDITSLLDHKFGNAVLSKSRAQAIQTGVSPKGISPPVIPIHGGAHRPNMYFGH